MSTDTRQRRLVTLRSIGQRHDLTRALAARLAAEQGVELVVIGGRTLVYDADFDAAFERARLRPERDSDSAADG